MLRYVRHPLLEEDIEDALRKSQKDFGPRQAARYAGMITDSIKHVVAFPSEGRRYRLNRGDWLLHIRKPGRRARHQLLYWIEDDGTIILLRLLHDRMTVRRHIPKH